MATTGPSGSRRASPQLVFNYVKALSDFMTNHCFSKGFTVKVDKSFAHITPALLDRVWSKDNDRQKLLWSIGQSGLDIRRRFH